MLEPLRGHPEEMHKFRAEVLYAPLPGSRKAKRIAQKKALAAMGLDPSKVKAGTKRARTGKGTGLGSTS